jgi:hypothetical protein
MKNEPYIERTKKQEKEDMQAGCALFVFIILFMFGLAIYFFGYN